MCCGGGGLLKMTNSALSANTASSRVKQIQENIRVVASSCPICKAALKDAAISLGRDIKVVDISEIAAERLRLLPPQ